MGWRAPAKLMAPGERADATLEIQDPGQQRRGIRIRRVPAQRPGSACSAHNGGNAMGKRSARTELPSNIVLAPMAGVTDRPFRMLCRRFGAGLAASEMLSADPRLWDTPKSRRRMDHEGEPSPRVVQIAGFDPLMMARAARHNVDAGARDHRHQHGLSGEKGLQPAGRFGAAPG